MMKKIVLLLMVISSVIVYANEPKNLTQTIRGTVRDKITGTPLIGANVIIPNTDPAIGTITNEKGSFQIEKVPLGRQTLIISYIGYNKQVLPNLLLTSGKEVVLDIKLEEKAYKVEEVTIRPERKKESAQNDMVAVSGRMFSVEETERFAGSLGDPARMVANYAGVMTQNDARNDIIIRGNSPSGVLWRLEGIEIGNPNHFGALGTTGGPVSMINNNLLSDSDFLTGAFPAEFGNATAGAFDLNLRSGNNQKTEFTGQVGFNGFEAGVEGPVFKRNNNTNPSYLINYRYSTLELMHELGFSTNTGEAIPEYNDLTFLIDAPATSAGRFKILGLRGKSFIALGHDISDSTDNSYNARGTTTDFGSDLGVLGLIHSYQLNGKTKIQSTLSYQKMNAETKIDSLKEDIDNTPYYRSKQDEEKISFSTRFIKKINAKNDFYLGMIADLYQVSFSDSIRDIDLKGFRKVADDKGTLRLFRAFGQFHHVFPNNISGFAGMHFQFNTINNEFVAEPRLGLKIPSGKKGSMNFGFGMHSQLQPKNVYFDEFLDENTGTYNKTNQDVGFTRSMHYVGGYDYLISNNFRMKLEAYYQHLYKVPVKESFPEFSMINAGDQFGLPRESDLINEGKGKNYGIELTIEKFLSNGYYFLFTSSLFQSKYSGYDEIWRNSAFNGNYVFNLLGGYEFNLGKKTMITLDTKTVFAGGKRYLPVDKEASINERTDVRNWENAYKNKYDPYFRTDFRIGVKMNGRGFSQEWAIDLQNLTNYESVFMEGFDVSKMETYKVYQQGFVPMFLYRIQF